MMDFSLPFIDEHQLFVDASTETVRDALTSWFAELSTSVLAAYLRVIAAQPRGPSATPLDLDATVPDFRVADSAPTERLQLTGRHRFSRYRLVFDLTPQDGKTVIRART